MQPIGNIWSKFPRLVRDLAIACNKQVRLQMDGRETELDKTIIEAIRDPLTHLVRNAIDHGIEPPEERVTRGKAAEGRLSLHASHEGGKVIIEIMDDGGGIDPKRVREKAIQVKLVTPEQADRLNDRELVNLVFLPGFSTAQAVSNISGRGVGMDVVLTTIERLGGQVAVSSRPRRGTTVQFTLPFTVMMTQVLTVEAAGQVFGVPMAAVVETVRVDRKAIAPVGAARAMVLRNRTLPVIDLARALGRGPGASAGDANVLIVSIAGQWGGLEVDRLGEPMDVMLKPPEGLLAGVPGIDGTTLLGDGRVLIVLDLHEIFDNADG
jgi:two-component system chemotaxis sensor kinase CheA